MHIPPSLKHRKFFYLWLGQLISITGTQMQLWALFWHINSLDKNPIALGGIGVARIVPVVLFSLIGGALADSVDRRRVMFITQSFAALLALALGLLTQFGHVTIWYIYAITALQAVAVAFDGPSRQALVPNLVPKQDLPNAFSMTFTAFQAGAVIGPALTGFVIASMGQEAVYYFNAVSFGAVLVALFMIGDVPQMISERSAGITLDAIADGIRFILAKPIIFSTMMIDFVATFFASANTLMPIIAKEMLDVGVVEYGYLSAASAVGAVAVALVISQVREIRRQGFVFLISVIIFGIATIVFGTTRSFLVAWLAIAVTGGADGVSTIVRNTIRQLQTPDHVRGRMTSINQIFFMGGPQLGEIEAGTVAQFFGAPFAVVTGGIGCIVGTLLVVMKWPQLKDYNGDEPIEAGNLPGTSTGASLIANRVRKQ
ncbi:MAG: MFS transporter [Anaerolineales bacterium]|nr:MAG: MFS transporter [Chloroflexota bacterium]MBE7436740.1 MFS transporter [Anaerolineales bacterium]MCK6585345.1 MFS transporter [Anaerolineales bacterium]